MEALQHCMEVDTDDGDKGELEAYNHMEDNTDDDIGQAEEASMNGDNVASAAFPNQACSPLTQKAHQEEDHLGME